MSLQDEWRTALGEKCPSPPQLEGFPQPHKLCQTREGKEGSGFLLAGMCWAEVLVLLQHHQTGHQSPQLWNHTAQTLLIPSQSSLWSCSCGSAGSVCGLEAAGTPQSRAHKHSRAGLLLQRRATWQLPAAAGTLKDRQDKGE